MQFFSSKILGSRRTQFASRTLAAVAVCFVVSAALPASAATLDRIKDSGHIKIGYFEDAKPFSSKTGGGAEGYAISLCQSIADKAKSQLGLQQLAVDWVPVTGDTYLSQVKAGSIDLLCAPVSATAARRKEVSFSLPVFAGGVRAVMSKDAAAALRNALAENPEHRPVWRGTPAAKLLEKKVFAYVKGTTTEDWVANQLKALQINAKVEPVADYRAGLQALTERKVDVLFGERSIVLGAMNDAQKANLAISDRMLTHEPLAFALARGDEDFRLLVDQTLSETYASDKFADVYKQWVGDFDDKTRTFFTWNRLAQ